MNKSFLFVLFVVLSLSFTCCSKKNDIVGKDSPSTAPKTYTSQSVHPDTTNIDWNRYYQYANQFIIYYSSASEINKTTKISVGTKIAVIGFYPVLSKTGDIYIPAESPNPTPWLLVIAIDKSEFKIEKTPQELSKKIQIGILNKEPFFLVVPSAILFPKVDFYFGNALTDPLVPEDNSGKRVKGFVGSLWFGYAPIYQIGSIDAVLNDWKKLSYYNSEGNLTPGYYENSDYYISDRGQ